MSYNLLTGSWRIPKNSKIINVKSRLENLRKQLDEIEYALKELKKRLPAHSTKPNQMKELLELEDKYDQITSEIKILKTGNHQ